MSYGMGQLQPCATFVPTPGDLGPFVCEDSVGNQQVVGSPDMVTALQGQIGALMSQGSTTAGSFSLTQFLNQYGTYVAVGAGVLILFSLMGGRRR